MKGDANRLSRTLFSASLNEARRPPGPSNASSSACQSFTRFFTSSPLVMLSLSKRGSRCGKVGQSWLLLDDGVKRHATVATQRAAALCLHHKTTIFCYRLMEGKHNIGNGVGIVGGRLPALWKA